MGGVSRQLDSPDYHANTKFNLNNSKRKTIGKGTGKAAVIN